MNDTELIHAVQDAFRHIQLATPVDSIVARGRALRRRRQLSAIGTAAAAGAAGTTLAVSLLIAGSSPAAAWTVTKEPDGTVAVTIRDLNHPNALVRKLQQDGVRANFDGPPTFTPQRAIDLACLRPMTPALHRALSVRASADPHVAALLLRPSARPPGTTLSIYWAGYSPRGYAHTKQEAWVSTLGPSSSRPGAPKVVKKYKIPLTSSGDFAFQAAFVNSAGRCVQ
jgi:hypothetical protein